MLRGAAPVNGHAARSTAARVETVSAKEPGSSRGTSEAEIRAADRTQRETLSRSGRGLSSSLTLKNERPLKSATTLRPSFFLSLPADELSHFNALLKTHFPAHQTTEQMVS